MNVQASVRSPSLESVEIANLEDSGTEGSRGGTARNGRSSPAGPSGPGRQTELTAYSDASNRILRQEDLDTVCRLFLETVRQHSVYRRAVLSLFDEQGRDLQHFFTGFSDAEIDHFHGHKPSARERATILQERFRVGHSYAAPLAGGPGFGLP